MTFFCCRGGCERGPLRRTLGVLTGLLAVGLLGRAVPAHANLVINPTFDSTITSDVNAATIMSTIHAAIQVYENTFTDNITVNIKFQEGGGLGSSSTWIYQRSYANYRADLVNDASTPDDNTALASLPVQANSPVDGNANLWLSHANLLAIGVNPGATPDGFDGTITLNTSIMNLDRITINPSKYDLMAVASHEIDEVLGLGSGLDLLSSGLDHLSRPEDLFRYSANGVRSYTTSSTATSYFSIDGGATNLVGFNQSGGGSDYGDWVSSSTPRVQDAYGTPGATPNLGVELVALDVIGYNRAMPAPEPSTLASAGLAVLMGLGYTWRRRKRTAA